MPIITHDLALTAEHLIAGKAVAIPTETVYGLAALIDNENAIAQVFSLKNRPLDHPLIVHVARDADLSSYIRTIPDYALTLMQHCWPGPLTLVLPAKVEAIPSLIRAGQSTVAVRCPQHALTEQLLAILKKPVVAPSANPFGKISPTTAAHVKDAFPDAKLTILDGGRCAIGIESTIVDATQADSYQILRQGLLSAEAIAKIIPTTARFGENAIKVPGKLASHYQPNKPLYYFNDFAALEQFCETNKTQRVYALANQRPFACEDYYPLPSSPEKFAFELYYQLRIADNSPADCIAIVLPPATAAWLGIRERIMKAGVSLVKV